MSQYVSLQSRINTELGVFGSQQYKHGSRFPQPVKNYRQLICAMLSFLFKGNDAKIGIQEEIAHLYNIVAGKISLQYLRAVYLQMKPDNIDYWKLHNYFSVLDKAETFDGHILMTHERFLYLSSKSRLLEDRKVIIDEDILGTAFATVSVDIADMKRALKMDCFDKDEKERMSEILNGGTYQRYHTRAGVYSMEAGIPDQLEEIQTNILDLPHGSGRRSDEDAACLGRHQAEGHDRHPVDAGVCPSCGGWYLRSDIIWNKINCLPESVRDRPTKSYEHIFLLSRSPRYFFDADAIKEPITEESRKRYQRGRSEGSKYGVFSGDQSINGSDYGERMRGQKLRNKRDTWHISTNSYRMDGHFAMFPEKLVEPCILAGSQEGGIVLDPFFGSGTTSAVAKRLGRRFIGIDLNPDYCRMAQQRIDAVSDTRK